MIKIGAEKLFSMTEILENLREYMKNESVFDIQNSCYNFEIAAVAALIGEHPDFVRGFVCAGRE